MDKTFAVAGSALLKTLLVGVFAASLSGCLGGGGGGGSSNNATPPAVEPPELVPPVDPEDPLAARTLQGDFRGIDLEGMRVFRGIRYGAPPKGELRFAAPVAVEEHTGEVQLSEEFGSDCPQLDRQGQPASVEEDCLFLNVYAPAEAGEYPVMVWVHGGALLEGAASEWMYSLPQRLVDEHEVVVVTLNYRLGTLGFLPHEALGENNNNFGIQDQQLALKWVQDNIRAFGGDASNVTLFGESAGGHSVMSHVASPGSAGLFHKAIVQSGSYLGTQLPLKDVTRGTIVEMQGGQSRMADPILDKTRCADLDSAELVSCLRDLDVEEILASQLGWMLPVWGTPTLPKSINDAIISGEFNKVPMILGSNLHEGQLYSLIELASGVLFFEPGYYAMANALLQNHVELDTQKVAEDYLASEPTSDLYRYFRARARIETDYRYACPNVEQWWLLRQQDVPVWGYWFTDEDAPGVPSTFGTMTHDFVGAAHAYEVPYLLMPFEGVFTADNGAGEEQIELAKRMTAYWANFAKYGEPTITDGTDAIGWPQYNLGATTDDRKIMRFDAPAPSLATVSEFFETHNCSYWEDPPTRPVWRPVF